MMQKLRRRLVEKDLTSWHLIEEAAVVDPGTVVVRRRR